MSNVYFENCFSVRVMPSAKYTQFVVKFIPGHEASEICSLGLLFFADEKSQPLPSPNRRFENNVVAWTAKVNFNIWWSLDH